MTQVVPSTLPMPVTIPALGASSSYSPFAASALSSRNAEPGSRRRSMRSRTGSLPRSRCRAIDRSSPPAPRSLDGRGPRPELRDERGHPLDVGDARRRWRDRAGCAGRSRPEDSPAVGPDRRGTGAAPAPSWRHGHHARPPARAALPSPTPRPADPPGPPVLRDRQHRRARRLQRRGEPRRARHRAAAHRPIGGRDVHGWPVRLRGRPRARRPRPQRREAAERSRPRLAPRPTPPSTPRSSRPTSRRCARKPFTGECPIAFDGQKQIFEFSVGSTTQRLDSCESELDWSSPLFIAMVGALGEWIQAPLF